ncbi:NAD(P)/FAD-dependent oxidoreductase [Occultella kanbiaonis]|uniref:NAD(P)/FAD-dependent oxidoreductase n=1 Tax=Occultella kanbiaonis TaxID=2675754 RepID=UPI0013D43D5A|nr:FAD-dependent oxidoreductase [Occultella kanbiaonis]
MTRNVDVLIVGGGVVGLAIAIELAADPGLHVTILDKGGPGGGASGRSAGVICRHDQGPSYQRLSLIGHARMKQLARERGLTFNTWGHLEIHRGDAGAPNRDRFADQFRAAPSGMYESEVLDRASTLKRFGWLAAPGVTGSVFQPHIGFIDPFELIDLYRAMLSDLPNVHLAYGTPVFGFESDGDRITRVLGRRGPWAPGVVINASGAWGAKVAKLAGARLELTPQRVNVAFSTDYDERRMPLHGVAGMSWEGAGVWARGEVGGGTIFGQHRDLTDPDQPSVDPDHVDTTTDAEFVTRLAPIVGDLYRTPAGSVLPGWTCVYDTTPDGFPLLGRDAAVDNLIHAVGMNGHGMTIHPGVARSIAELVRSGSLRVDISDVMPWPDELDITELRPSRFDEGASLKIGQH